MNDGKSYYTQPQSPNGETLVSIVVPAYNERGNLGRLYEELTRVFDTVDTLWELVIVDDGSTDDTWTVVEQLHGVDERVRGIRFSRNFGHQHALIAGLRHAAGDAVISMDADLQHPPPVIPRLLAEWRNGNRIVNTIRSDSVDVPFMKRVTSRAFASVFSFLTGVRLEHGMADFRLLDRTVVEKIARLPEEGLFLRGIVHWVGFPNTTIGFECGKRYSGATKYTYGGMIRFAWSGVTSFSLVPLRIAIMIGIVSSLLSFGGILYAIYGKWIEGHAVPGWTSNLAIMSLLFGFLFIFLGVLGEYVGRILIEVRQRPRYIVREHLGLEEEGARPEPGTAPEGDLS